MYFTKYPHRANFSFAGALDPKTGEFKAGARCFGAKIESYRETITRIRIENRDTWGPNKCLTELAPPPPDPIPGARVTKEGGLEILDGAGKPLLALLRGEGFGVNADSWMFRFKVRSDARYYGMGEKTFGRLELSGVRTKFWNTDVWGDFHIGQWEGSPTDPPYLSVPYVIVKQGDTFVGILVHSAYPAFIETPGLDRDRVFAAWQHTSAELIVGAEGGQPDVWIIVGPSLKELTRKLQRLVGLTPLPPAWSLGYQQCRWGYAGEKDLLDLDANFMKADIPCDGLWLDIDYMRGYRVFTVDERHFPDGVAATAKKLKARNHPIVAILDPGVKFEKGYDVYDDGHAKKVFCLNREGGEFVGMVWPGETVFPDFTLPEGREWWAGYVEKFAKDGFGAAWLDMNDVSTGPVDPTGMLFNHGAERHEQHRNQYSLGMQMASREGFLRARPNERPFLLSRSGFVGTSKYSAVWTGDNVSSYFYLKMSLPTSLNLSLSGIPFNGPDVGGFGMAPTEQLMLDWMKACFLYPFFRNHNGKSDLGQEPWAFSERGVHVIRKFIRLRYRLIPYLYNLFIDQEETGDPILRPLLYEFAADKRKSLIVLDDEFMVGPSILQAPLVAKSRKRKVLLPGKARWLDGSTGEWIESGTLRVAPSDEETPLYIRDGSVLPLQQSIDGNRKDFRCIDLLIAADPGSSGSTEYVYRADDGISFDYQHGKRSELVVKASWDHGVLSIEREQTKAGFGEIDAALLIPLGFSSVLLNGRAASLHAHRLELTGRLFDLQRVG